MDPVGDGYALLRVASLFDVVGLVSAAVFSVWLSIGDVRARRLPNGRVACATAVTLGVLLLAVGLRFIAAGWAVAGVPLCGLLGGAVAFFAVFLVSWLAAPRHVGAGDVKIAPLVGGVLGYFGVIPALLIGLAVAFACAAVWGIAERWRARHQPLRHVAFAPCLFAGMWVGTASSFWS